MKSRKSTGRRIRGAKDKLPETQIEGEEGEILGERSEKNERREEIGWQDRP